MKAKVASVQSVYLSCPACGSGEVIERRDGSMLIEVMQVQAGDTFECLECGARLEVPAELLRMQKRA